VENFALTTSMLSNALINIYSPDGQGYKLNDISVIDNTVYSIQVQYAYGLRIIGNNVIGSNNTQSNLVYVRGSEFVAITGNNFVANYAVATGLQCCVDQYCNNNYVCSGNTADNSGGVAFSRNVTGTVGTVTSDPVKIFINNNALSGIYSTVSETESAFNAVAMFRLSIVGSATPTDVAASIKVAMRLLIAFWYENREDMAIKSGVRSADALLSKCRISF